MLLLAHKVYVLFYILILYTTGPKSTKLENKNPKIDLSKNLRAPLFLCIFVLFCMNFQIEHSFSALFCMFAFFAWILKSNMQKRAKGVYFKYLQKIVKCTKIDLRGRGLRAPLFLFGNFGKKVDLVYHFFKNFSKFFQTFTFLMIF